MVLIASYGGGTNSTAMLIECAKRGIQVDLILFADTGAEKPHTYEYVKRFSDWLQTHGMPEIITVQSQDKDGNYYTLEQRCIDHKMLPSIAYGFKACSEKHKQRPQNKYVNNWQPAKDEWAKDKKVIKLIGFDADEEHRAKIPEDNMKNLNELNKYRNTNAERKIYGVNGDGENGLFEVPCPATARTLTVIASSGEGWEHVSVSTTSRCPNWTEMDYIKRLFFRDDETAMQLHVPVEEHINCHPNCLHLWRPVSVDIPRPPGFMVAS